MSDQDFFFDEEDDAQPSPARPAKTEQRKAAPAPRSTSSKGESASSPAFFEQSVSMMVAALMAVIGLLVGVIIGFVIAPADGGSAVPTSPASSSAPAPLLSPDQLESGALPEGHPPIDSMTGDMGAETTETAPVEDGADAESETE
ncbi:MAG: hypothetical protein ISP10_07160 [Aeromicrobium sp.]|nr:hypothetical protein [Aeromicrobium sp.]